MQYTQNLIFTLPHVKSNMKKNKKHCRFGLAPVALNFSSNDWAQPLAEKRPPEGEYQRILYLSDRTHSTPSVFQTCVSPNLSPCSVRQSGSWSGVLYVYCRQSRKRLGETCLEDAAGCCAITNIYSLGCTPSQ